MRHNLLIVGVLLSLSALAPVAPAAETLSLAGTWRFRRDADNLGLEQKWYAGPLPAAAGEPDSIPLPGTTDEAQAGLPNTKPPTLDALYRPNVYTGAAWYQREVEIPAGWHGKHLALLLERVRWVSQAWLDDESLGDAQDSLIAPHVYEIHGDVSPGKHRLTLRVDNTPKINLGIFVSALYGGTATDMNGIVGRIELVAHDPLWIDSQQVYADNDGTVRVAVKVGRAMRDEGRGTRGEEREALAGTLHVTVTDRATGAVAGEGSAKFEYACGTPSATETVTLKLRQAPKLWSEFTPALYVAKTEIGTDARGKQIRDTAETTFGFRQVGTQGTQLTVNGRPIYLRGTLECAVFPVTGYPPTDVAWWQRVCRIIKTYGLNHLRFHSWCPPDAAFAAADIEGIMIQAEGPQANVPAGQDPARDAFMEQELLRIVRTYGNHPSFCLMTLGNEYGGDDAVLTHWVEMLIREDPRHLYSSASNNHQVTANRQFTVTPLRGIRGPDTDHDFGERMVKEDRPLVSHEIGQWMFFPRFEEMAKYTGVFRPRNFEIIRDDLQSKGLLDLAPRYAQAWGRQAVLLYKEEMEVLMRTPGHAGFQLLDLHDYPSQGTALIGPLDPFWDSKGFVAPEEHRRYCGPTVPLARLTKRTFTADERLEATADVAHFGPQDLDQAQAEWRIADGRGTLIASGTFAQQKIPTGRLTPLGAIQASLAQAPAPCKLKLEVSLKGTEFANDWDLWVYPQAAAIAPPAAVTVCHEWNAAREALAEGKTVAFLPQRLKFVDALPGRFLPVFWSPVWFPKQKPNTMGVLCDPQHPALAQFPTDEYTNWQWWDLLENSCTVSLDATPATFRPIVQVMDNFARNKKLGNLFEARVGPGRLLACTINLVDRLDQRPVARQLLTSLTAYMGSATFQPQQELSVAVLDKIFAQPSSRLARMDARVLRADSEDRAHGNLAAMAIDGDPTTIWHTRWQPNDPLPHTLVIDLGQSVSLRGITYLPRQDQVNGRIAEAEIFAATDPTRWGPPAAKVQWPNTPDLQRVEFPAPITARYLKLVATREHRGQPFTAIAELDILVDEP